MSVTFGKVLTERSPDHWISTKKSTTTPAPYSLAIVENGLVPQGYRRLAQDNAAGKIENAFDLNLDYIVAESLLLQISNFAPSKIEII